MSKIVGVSYQKGKIRYSVLELSGSAVSYSTRNSIKYDPELEICDLMDRWRLDFGALFQDVKPNIAASVEVWESDSLNSSRFQIMPLAILAQACKAKDLPLRVYTPQALARGGPFGLAAKTKPIEAVDDTFGAHPPYWDDLQRRSVLVAWRAALEN